MQCVDSGRSFGGLLKTVLLVTSTKMAVMPIFGKKKASKNLTPHYKKDKQI